MFEEWKRERAIRRTLKRLAGQRVAMVLQPQNVQVIERALMHDADTPAILLTCRMRGWVEVLEQGVPHGSLAADGSLPLGKMYDRIETIYRLTDSGWNAINRAHGWTLVGSFLAFLSLLATIVVASIAGPVTDASHANTCPEARHISSVAPAPTLQLPAPERGSSAP